MESSLKINRGEVGLLITTISIVGQHNLNLSIKAQRWVFKIGHPCNY